MIAPSTSTEFPPDAARIERLLENLCAGDQGLCDLAAGLDVSLGDLARLVAAPANAALFDGLLHLAEVRSAMAVCRYRSVAAAVLVNIAAQKDDDDQHADLSRKACVDLLNVELPDQSRVHSDAGERDRRHSADSSMTPPPAATAEAILAAFDRLEQQEAAALDGLARTMKQTAALVR